MISFKEFLTERASINKNVKLRDNPKLLAYYDYDIEEFRRALREGDNPDIANAYGDTPLHNCAKFNDTDYLKVLIEFGADVNYQNELKRTPLHIAVIHNNYESFVILMEYGADITIRDYSKTTPFGYARKGSVLDYLMDYSKRNKISSEEL